MTNITKLYGFAFILSLVVIWQSLFVLEKLTLKDKPEEKTGSSQAIEEIVKNTEENPEASLTSQPSVNKAKIWLETKDTSSLNSKKVNIWMEATTSAYLADLKINFSPQLVKIIDKNSAAAGTQIGFGDGDIYLQNEVDAEKGSIFLVVRFDKGFKGKELLGSIDLEKTNPDVPVIFNFDYLSGSKEGSYVIEKGGENILEKPEGLEI